MFTAYALLNVIEGSIEMFDTKPYVPHTHILGVGTHEDIEMAKALACNAALDAQYELDFCECEEEDSELDILSRLPDGTVLTASELEELR